MENLKAVSELTFSDGVKYTIAEAMELSRADGDTVRAVHLVKKLFDGELIIKGVNDHAPGISRMYPRWKSTERYAMAETSKKPRISGGSRRSKVTRRFETSSGQTRLDI